MSLPSPRRTFTVTTGQVGISYIAVTSRGWRHVAIAIGTIQKYPEVLGYGGTEICLKASQRTRDETYDPDAQATCVQWPRRWRGWQVITESGGRYEIALALIRPGSRSRDYLIEAITNDERVARIRSGR